MYRIKKKKKKKKKKKSIGEIFEIIYYCQFINVSKIIIIMKYIF